MSPAFSAPVRGLLGEPVPREQQLGAGVLEVVRDLAPLEEDVHGDDHGARPHDPVVDDGEVRDVRQHHPDAIARTDATIAQESGDPRAALVQKAVGDLRIVQLHRHVIGAAARGGGHDARQVHVAHVRTLPRSSCPSAARPRRPGRRGARRARRRRRRRGRRALGRARGGRGARAPGGPRPGARRRAADRDGRGGTQRTRGLGVACRHRDARGRRPAGGRPDRPDARRPRDPRAAPAGHVGHRRGRPRLSRAARCGRRARAGAGRRRRRRARPPPGERGGQARGAARARGARRDAGRDRARRPRRPGARAERADAGAAGGRRPRAGASRPAAPASSTTTS